MYKNHVGSKFGKLTVIQLLEYAPNGRTKYLCKCDCGNIKVAVIRGLREGSTKSCGCLKKENSWKKHGKSGTRMHQIWLDMKSRCVNKNTKCYKYYGGKGIEVCEEWKTDYMNFYNWAMSNGYKDNLTIDRIDVNGNYEPNNCRWATMKVQNNNLTSNHKVEYNGTSYNITQLSEKFGINRTTIYSRIKRGMSIYDVINTPIKNKIKEKK